VAPEHEGIDEPDEVAPEPPPTWLRVLGLGDRDRPLLHQLGLAAWAIIGLVALSALVVWGLATVSSVVLPLLFAAVLAVIFRPLAVRLERLGVPASLAAGIVVLGLIAVIVAVVVLTVLGIVDQSDRLMDELEAALVELDIDQDVIDEVQAAIEDADPAVTSGIVAAVMSGLSAAGAVLVGALLGTLIMYYLIKDGDDLRRTLVARAPPEQRASLDEFVSETSYVLRRYWLGRSIVSAVVAAVVGSAALVLGLPLVGTIAVVTFVGGFIPYIGAVVGGALAVIVALGSEGPVAAVVMLAVVLVANLLIENLVEPAVTGRTLSIHPLVVLLVTTLGGILGGLVGLVMAVPLTVIATKAIPRMARVLDVGADHVREQLAAQATDDVADGEAAPDTTGAG
jgi:predicted PurR-regulated permease PerM